jgi:hypothetical protein
VTPSVSAAVQRVTRQIVTGERIGPVERARDDPPWKPWFLRRNDVLVELAEPEP